MSKVPYNKPALTYAEQIKLLIRRGLIIENENKAAHLLDVISYYRLSGYWYPMLANKQNHQFKPGSLFETAFKIYKFDRELRLFIMRELEKNCEFSQLFHAALEIHSLTGLPIFHLKQACRFH